MRKLRDAETAHKLQQIAEVDEQEDSDDAFGPVGVPADGYNMVSNRSTYRQGTASRESQKRNSNAFASNQEDLHDEGAGFEQPMPDLTEDAEDLGLSSRSKKKKGKKKKKRAKKAALAAIHEDLQDSPVQSAEEDDFSPKIVKEVNASAADKDVSGDDFFLPVDQEPATEVQANGAATSVAGEPEDNNN